MVQHTLRYIKTGGFAMDIIQVTIEYGGEITFGGEYTAKGPLQISWFPGNDLKVEANGKTVTISAKNAIAGSVYKLPKSLFE